MMLLMIDLLKEEKDYYYFVIISLLFLLWRYRNNILSVLIVLCFYSGLAFVFDKGVENPYKILIVFTSVFLLIKFNVLVGLKRNEKVFLFYFILFAASFILSGFLNNDSFSMIFSQFGKFLTPICIFFLLKYFINSKPEFLTYFRNLFFTLLIVQVVLTFYKWDKIGIQEWIVGSITYLGGGEATPLPVLGFMLIWISRKGTLKRNDWIFVFLLLIIGFVSMKRAIWFIMPVFIMLFMYYVPKHVNLKKVIYFVPFIPLIFYLGVKYNPTLNKEGKFGGSFDFNYVLDYVLSYNFGKTSETKSVQLGQGRGGATLLIWDKLTQNKQLNANDYFGFGLTKMYSTDYDTFDKFNFGLSNKGAATGIFQTYVTSGYVGIIFTFLFIISIINLITISRIKIVIGTFIFYDYLFYNGLVLRTPALLILLFFIILYSSLQFEKSDFPKEVQLT